jgi:hypothetical protein
MCRASRNEHWPTLPSLKSGEYSGLRLGRVMRDRRFESIPPPRRVRRTSVLRRKLVRISIWISTNRVDFDPDLLHALLRVSKYRHGARSLEKLMEPLRGPDARPRALIAIQRNQVAPHPRECSPAVAWAGAHRYTYW